MNPKPITKAVIAAAGFGTRFLPQTKAMPKEMLPIIDKPTIQYIVEELVAAGIEDIIIVTGYHKRSVEDHFDQISADLEQNLTAAGKDKLLHSTQKVSELANFVYIRQKGPYGNATPLMNAEHIVGDKPFIFTFADDFVVSSPPRFKQLVEAHNKLGGIVLTCVEADKDDDYKRYGYVGGDKLGGGLINVKKIIEKPGSREASPSTTASVSGYILDPKIFEYLKQDLDNLDKRSEFIMQPAIQRMIEDGLPVHGLEVAGGRYYDTGSKLEYLKTVVDFALRRDDIKDDFKKYLQSI